MNAPRVLVSGIVLGQPMGGVRRHNLELLPRVARLLAEHGGSLCVLEGRERVAFELPAPIERIESDVPAGPPLVRSGKERRALQRALEEARARGRPFDLVHVAHLPAPRGLAVPFTLTLHDLRHLEASRTSVRGWLGPRVVAVAAREAARVITVSESVRRELVRRLRLDAARIDVVSNAADHLAPLARRATADAPLLCVGHIEPRKNLELVVHALALDPTLPRLLVAGAEKPGHAAKLRELARDLGVESRVELRGPFDDGDLPRLLAECAAVVLPSRLEGFGIVALEAQRALAPLAIAHIPALVEVAGEAGPSFSPDDPRGCALAIAAALRMTASELAAARERAARFTWDASARAWFDAWRAAAVRGS